VRSRSGARKPGAVRKSGGSRPALAAPVHQQLQLQQHQQMDPRLAAWAATLVAPAAVPSTAVAVGLPALVGSLLAIPDVPRFGSACAAFLASRGGAAWAAAAPLLLARCSAAQAPAVAAALLQRAQRDAVAPSAAALATAALACPGPVALERVLRCLGHGAPPLLREALLGALLQRADVVALPVIFAIFTPAP
jgi:hypothetical protein